MEKTPRNNQKRGPCVRSTANDRQRAAATIRLPRPTLFPFPPPSTSHFICGVRGGGCSGGGKAEIDNPLFSRGKWGSFAALEYIKEVGRARQTNPVRFGWEGVCVPDDVTGIKPPPSPTLPSSPRNQSGKRPLLNRRGLTGESVGRVAVVGGEGRCF